MAIPNNPDPVDLLASDVQSGIEDIQKIGQTENQDLVQVASSKLVNTITDIVKQGESSATKQKDTGPVTPKTVETVEEAVTSIDKAKEFEADDYIRNFNSSDDIINNLGSISGDLKTPINKVKQTETIKGADDELANILDMGKNWNKDNTMFSASQVVAAKNALINSSETITKIAKAIKAGDDSSATLFLFREAVSRHASLVQTYKYGRANVARALNAFKIPGDFVGSQGEFEKLVIEELGGSKAATMMAEQILDAKSLKQINDYTVEAWSKKSADTLMEIYINGLLSSPRTQFRNLFGNLFYQGYKIPEMAIAAGFNTLESGIKYVGKKLPITKNVHYFKNPADGVTFEQVYARMHSYTYSWGKAWQAASKAVKETPSTDKLEMANYQKKTISAETYGYKSNSTMGYGIDLFGKFIRMPGTALVWGDEFFKTMAKYAEESDLAIQYAHQLQRKGIPEEQIPEMVTDYIYTNPVALKQIDEAKKAMVFQDDLGPLMKQLQKTIGDTKIMGFPILRVNIPFMKTPLNIYKAVYNRSIGIGVKGLQLGVDQALIISRFRKEPYFNYSKKFREDAQFRNKEMGMASMAIGAFAYTDYLHQNGTITGPPPRDAKQRDYYLNTLGIQPHSFVFYGPNSDRSKPLFDDNGVPNGDLRYVSYLGIEPFGSFFGIMAHTRQMMQNSTNPVVNDNLPIAFAMASASYFKEIPFLHGISEFLDVLGGSHDDPEKILNIEKLIKQYSTVIVPYSSFNRDLERLFDPTKRYIGPDYEIDLEPLLLDEDGEVVVDDRGIAKPNPNYGMPQGEMSIAAKNFMNEVMSVIPGASQSFAPVYGYEFEAIAPNNGFGWGQRIYNTFVPMTLGDNRDLMEYQKDIYRLNVPGYSLNKQMYGLNFTDRQWSKLNETAGQITGTGSNRNRTFKEALEYLYLGTSSQSRTFLTKKGNMGSNDDLRIATLSALRKEYLDKAFDILSFEDEDFGKMAEAKQKKEKYLDDNLLGRY